MGTWSVWNSTYRDFRLNRWSFNAAWQGRYGHHWRGLCDSNGRCCTFSQHSTFTLVAPSQLLQQRHSFAAHCTVTQANKIGTYMVALAAADNAVPFYVAFPSTTIDWRRRDGRAEIPIEQRNAHELAHVRGMDIESGKAVEVRPQQF